MPQLSPAGTQLVQELASRYGISADGVTHMLIAVHHGNGSMAQFSHPDFGGSGQWMRGGMTMVSDLFNHQLKALVDNLCNELSNALASHQSTPFSGSFQSQSQSGSGFQDQAAGAMGGRNSLFVPDPRAEWWPKHLGTPSAVGSQNNVRYAYFADSGRLAVSTGGPAWVYDTLDHRIGGFGQQQGGGSSITFTSQYGTVDLSALPVVWRDGAPIAPPLSQSTPPPVSSAQTASETTSETANEPARQAEPGRPPQTPASPPSPAPTAQVDDAIALLEKLGQLKEKGYITEEEFQEKKRDILSRI